jgi:hypothetical protein
MKISPEGAKKKGAAVIDTCRPVMENSEFLLDLD